MKVALVTTTINIPTVLRHYRACDSDVMFFITGDRKTPDVDVIRFLGEMESGTYHYYGATAQERLGYECSELLGWNTIGRRSIAILEALKWGADIIVSIDDDNLPMGLDYFDSYRKALCVPFTGLCADGFSGWFDVGRLLNPPAPHRGFPFGGESLWAAKSAVDVKVGVAAGMCLGDPDIAAVTRISQGMTVHGVSETLCGDGLVVDPGTLTVFNSQNVAFLRELAPCFLMVPQWKRYDDIFASLIAQRVMREREMYVRFGRPFAWQNRNPHNLLKDLQAEMFGMEHVVELAAWLGTRRLSESGSVLEHVGTIYSEMKNVSWMPEGVSELGAAWIKDCEKVM